MHSAQSTNLSQAARFWYSSCYRSAHERERGAKKVDGYDEKEHETLLYIQSTNGIRTYITSPPINFKR